ncbi:hypothetical protein BVJ62_19505, partial [Vibrio cholerae]|nr:hypothetical protein [Vibrio cholerae]
VSSPIEPRWFRLLCLSLVLMRCQPLRRALAVLHGGKNEFLGVFYTFYSNSMCLFTCIDWSCD